MQQTAPGSGHRLRAAASFPSFHPPSCMAVRRTGTASTGGGGGGDGRPLAAVAGPMGITIVDVTAPQRPWLVLDYSSFAATEGSRPSGGDGNYGAELGSGGITTMAFQPCPSSAGGTTQRTNVVDAADCGTHYGGRGRSGSSAPVLLAAARGSGILIWDCSGRALSPLLGRLNASDSSSSWGNGAEKTMSAAGTGDNSMESGESGNAKSKLQPVGLDATTINATSVTPQETELVNSNPSKKAAASSSTRRDVTSLAWRGPSSPVLLSTCGSSASLWDLRTSLFSVAGGDGASAIGARPNARFASPHDGFAAEPGSSATLIHCAYARDESDHAFATLDSVGVVRVWDDRKADRPRHSFLACPGGGVGVASMASSANRNRWVTWGMGDDDEDDFDDDLIVKVWTESTALDGPNANDRNDDCVDIRTSYQVTSRIPMAGAAAARLHPSFANGVLLFRDNPSSEKDRLLRQRFDAGALTSTSVGEREEGGRSEGVLLKSPADQHMFLSAGLKMRASPEMAIAQTPPSPPPLMLGVMEETTTVDRREPEQFPSPRVHEGWEAELWCVDPGQSTLDSDVKEETEESSSDGVLRARKVTAFRGGGVEEDSLSFAPGRGDVSSVIAVDLALGGPMTDELSLCVVTKAGLMTVYGVPEASDLLEQERASKAAPPRRRVDMLESNETDRVTDMRTHPASSRVYHQGAADHHHTSPWWDKKEEEDLFGDSINSPLEIPKKSPIESARVVKAGDSSTPIETNTLVHGRGPLRMADSINEKASTSPSIIPDVDLSTSMDEGDQEYVDPAVAARVPCPPLCGVSFSGVGGLVTFSNGPVKSMWSYYQSNEMLSPNSYGPQTLSNFVLKPHMKSGNEFIFEEEENQDSSSTGQGMHSTKNQTLPRTLADLIEMNLRSQTLQWGDNEPPEDAARDHASSSSSSSDGTSGYEDGELESDGGISDSDDSGGFYHVSTDDSPQRNLDYMLDDYFSESRKSLLDCANQGNIDPPSTDEKFAGLPSLSPSVVITRMHDDILLNGMTPKLAKALALGDCWWLTKDFVGPVANWQSGDTNRDISETNNDADFARNITDPYLSVGPFSGRTMALSSPFSSASKGETSMMGSLKKLFAHQLQIDSTPPDQHKLLNGKSKHKSSHVEHPKVSSHCSNILKGSNSPLSLGVYTRENPQTPEAISEQLAIAQKICVHNARVCSHYGQNAKADTWILLSETIESISIFESDETDGWGGVGDALTSGVVEQILRYYELQGDFQMLSTILCVLLCGRDRRFSRDSGKWKYQLLPMNFDGRYDNYLHRYADLLYGWGELTVRSEISKRLAYNTPSTGEETLSQFQTNISEEQGVANKCTKLPNSGAIPGITFSPVCGNEYSVQCSICCSPVRGACTWCPLCGHGGHVDHMMEWFQHQTVCPTGCGCICNPRTTY